MTSPLIAPPAKTNYLFDLSYEGPSFDGSMEISALTNELAGIEEVIRIATQILAKYKRIDFTAKDLRVVVEAFEKGSFKKKIKSLNDYQGVIALAALIVSMFGLIPHKKAITLSDLSPEVINEIGDKAKLDLLSDPRFLRAMSNVVSPLDKQGDQVVFITPSDGQRVSVDFRDKNEFLILSEGSATNDKEGKVYEILTGRINRVDLDAKVRDLGFKVNGGGTSIPATLSDQIKASVDMKGLLDQWVEIKGFTDYQHGLRTHIDIQSIKIISQQELRLKPSDK